MKHLWYLFGLFFLFTGPAASQMMDTTYLALFHLQFQQAGFSGFNQQSGELGYPALEPNITEYGMSLQMRQGHWMTELGGYAGFGQAEREVRGAPFTEYQHYGIRLQTSWSALNSSSWFIGPYLSANPQWSKLVLSNPTEARGLQAALLADYHKFTRFNLPADIGLNIQHFFSLGEFKVVTLSLQAGYRLDDEDGWRVDGATEWLNSGIRLHGWHGAVRLGFRSW